MASQGLTALVESGVSDDGWKVPQRSGAGSSLRGVCLAGLVSARLHCMLKTFTVATFLTLPCLCAPFPSARRFRSLPFQDQGLQHARLVFQFYFVGAVPPTPGAPNPFYDANGCASK